MKENKMGSMKIDKLILSMSGPMILSMMVQALYNIVDSIFVSKISEDALTSVSLSFPIQNLMIACSVGTTVGVNALLARSLGEKNVEKANKIANIGIFLSFLLGFLFMLMGMFFTEYFFARQDVSDTIKLYATSYTKIVCIFSYFLCLQICYERLFSATGRANYTMITQMVGAITNIILDPIFIFYFGMGVSGAAIATVIGQTVGTVVGYFLCKYKTKEIHLTINSIMSPNFTMIKEIYKISTPSIVMQSVGSFTLAGFNAILILFSSTAVAFFGVYFKLQTFIILPLLGISNSIVPIISYNYGAKDKKRILSALKIAIIYSLIITSVGFFVLQVFPVNILKIFNASDDMLKIGVPALRTMSFAYFGACISIQLSSTFQALGNAHFSLIISLIRQLIFLLPLAYLFSLTKNINMVWCSFVISETVALLMCVAFFKIVIKKINF